MTIQELVDIAYSVTGIYKPSEVCQTGSVGVALLIKDGNVYTGVNIDAPCGIGFCAEHAAIAEMLKHKESEIVILAAVNTKKILAAPCGRCRELIYQINKANVKTKVILNQNETITLKELLPHHWLDTWK